MKRTKSRAAQRPGTKTAPWWEEAEEAPRAGLPDAEALSKRAKRYRRIVWATVFLAPLALFTTFITVASAGSGDTAAESATSDAYTATRSRALYTVRSWLATEPSPLPGGILLGWEKASTVEHPTDGYAVETHHLTVAEPGGNLFDTTVALGVSGPDAITVIGEPTLIPRVPTSESWSASLWPKVPDAIANEATEAAVWAWATAYTSGDPSTLKLAMGDTNANRAYIPLTGARFTDLSINTAGALWPQDATAEDRTGDPAKMLVNVTAEVTWPGAVAGGDTAPISYDLLLIDANTGAPRVVAWGGSGTGTTLKPYTTNAVTGIDVEAPAVDTETPKITDEDITAPEKAAAPTEKQAQKKPAKRPAKKKADR